MRLAALLPALLALAACDGGGPAEPTEPAPFDVVWRIPKTEGVGDAVRPVVREGRAIFATDSMFAVDPADGSRLWARPIYPATAMRGLVTDDGEYGQVYAFVHDLHWIRAVSVYGGAYQPFWFEAYRDRFQPLPSTSIVPSGGALHLNGAGVVQRVLMDHRPDYTFRVDRFAPAGVVELAHPVAVSGGSRITGGPWVEPRMFVPVSWSVPGDSVRDRGAVYAFDTRWRDVRWAYEVPPVRVAGGGWESTAATGVVATEENVAVTAGSRLFGLDWDTGEVLWERPSKGGGAFESGLSMAGPNIYKMSLYAASTSGHVHKVDLVSGDLRWTTQVDPGLRTALAVRDGLVAFTHHGTGELWVLDDESGQPLWHGRPPEPGARFLSDVGVGDGHLVVVGDRFVYGIKAP